MQHHFIARASESEHGRKIIEFFDNFIRPVLNPDRNWDILMAEPTSGEKLAKIVRIKIAKISNFFGSGIYGYFPGSLKNGMKRGD